MYETLVGFRDCCRYLAHSKIDDSLAQFPRGGERAWHSSLIHVGAGRFSGAIRTRSNQVKDALSAAKWRPLILASEGEAIEAYVEVAPKKPNAFDKFRDREFALEYVNFRLKDSGAFSNFDTELISQTTIVVRKRGNGYSAPSAWIGVKGIVASREAYEKLVFHGIGGSQAFGVGRLNPKGTALFDMAQAVAHALA